MSRISSHPTEHDRPGLEMAFAALNRRSHMAEASHLVRLLIEQADRKHAASEPSYEALATEAAQLREEVERLRLLSVERVMLDVVPGDGDGYEVYAESVDQVEEAIGSLGMQVEDLQFKNDQLRARLAELEAVVMQRNGGLATYTQKEQGE